MCGNVWKCTSSNDNIVCNQAIVLAVDMVISRATATQLYYIAIWLAFYFDKCFIALSVILSKEGQSNGRSLIYISRNRVSFTLALVSQHIVPINLEKKAFFEDLCFGITGERQCFLPVGCN